MLLFILILTAGLFGEGRALTDIKLTFYGTNGQAPDACGPHGVCDCAFYMDFNDIYCKGIDIYEVPRNIPANATFLYIIETAITEIPVEAFWNLTHLEELNLERNKITKIPEQAFFNLALLKLLDLKRNMINVLSPEVFSRLTSLTKLRLEGNQLKALHCNLFSKLTNLKSLYLNDNMIAALPHNIFWNLYQLERLYIFNNYLTTLPGDLLRNLTSLILLDASFNKVNTLPSSVFFNLVWLDNLDLSGNQLEILPENIFADLIRLSYLDLSTNQITILPEKLLWNLSSLTQIALYHNNIEIIPENLFCNITQLDQVVFDENEIKAVPRVLFLGITVGSLDFSGNKISSLPQDIFANTTVTEALDFADNQLTEVPAAIIKPNRNRLTITMLFLQSNRLTAINSGSFDKLINLKVVFLSNNYIQTMDEGVFNGPNLQWIFLFSNRLTEVLHNPFTGSMIKEVHIYGNNIKNLSKEFVKGVRNESTIFVNCASLSQLPRSTNNETIKCVDPQSLPKIHLLAWDIMVADYFDRNGFECEALTETCVPCRPGTFADRVTVGCQPCPRGGFFQDGIGQLATVRGGVACKQCNKGTYVKSGGGSSTKDCEVCPGGTNQSTFAGYRACSCKENYARTDRYGPCTLCREDGLNCSEDYRTLLPGYMWNWDFPDADLSNYKQFIANLKKENRLLDSYTSYNETFPVIFECPRQESCINDEEKIEGTCAEGYQGWLCYNCQPSYYSVLNVCVHCPNIAILILETSAFFIACVLIMVFILWQMKKEDGSHETRTILDVIISRIKLLLGFYQVVGEIFTSFHDINWTGPLVIIGSFISSLEMNILKLFVRPRCYDDRLVINPKIEFILAVSIPVAVILFPFISFVIKKVYVICRRRFVTTNLEGSFEGLKSKLFTCVVVLLFIIYPSVCSSIFQLYPHACKTFFLDDNSRYYIKRLRSDLDVSCDNLGTYNALAYVFTVVYVIGFPASLLYVLWIKWRQRNVHDEKGLRQQGLDEVVRHDQVHEDNDDDDEDSPLLINDSRPTKAAMTTPWLEFLCENYKDDFWFWEIIELTRKVSQTLLITLYGWEDRLTVLLTTCISVIFLVLHARYRPMKNPYEQHLQMLSLTVIFINVLVAANGIPDTYEDPVSIVLIILNVLVLMIISGEVLCTAILHVKHAGAMTFIARVRKSSPGFLIKKETSTGKDDTQS
ncbi:uncharacterized protein [Apostichopus japonicus]|uniref:uncharacterized protein n=1 Tax=Stichopus japonicus TaxID=307972 RepID=UPI003AB6C494